jgi:flavodoxin
MKNILVSYQSKHGTTKKYAEAIAVYINAKHLNSTAISIEDCKKKDIDKADAILLGCWTNGLMILFQHPDKPWVSFAKKLPSITDKRIGLFTTYKIATGSVFRKMTNALDGKIKTVEFEIKSRNGLLSVKDKQLIDIFIST